MSDGSILHELFPEGIYLIPEEHSASEAKASKSSEVQMEPEPSGRETPSRDDTPAEATYKGANKQEVLVLYAGPARLTDDQELFLSKVLSAVGLSFDDIALMYLPENTSSWENVPSKKILLFGCDSLLPSDTDTYIPHDFAGKVILHADALNLIMSDKQNKARLWSGLKQMFGL